MRFHLFKKNIIAIKNRVKIKIQTVGSVDNKGFQKLEAVDSIGSTHIAGVGKWHPFTGEVNATKNIFSGNTVNLKVKPGGIGSDKFNIKENMYFSNLSFEDFSLVARS